MGKKFGERLKDFLWGGAEELASEAIGALGIGNGAQVRQQQRLNESAAETNYRWGEKAAQNAYNRQMQMYERSYADQSYSAMVKQLRDAGLSVGLIYGNGGSGGQGGATTGAPMGDTGGAVAGEANKPMSAADRANAIAQRQGLAMQRETLEMNKEVAASQSYKNYAEGQAALAGAGLDNENAETIRQSRQWVVEKLKEEGLSKFLDNLEREFNNSENFTNGYTFEKSGAWGLYKIEVNSATAQKMRGVIQSMYAEVDVQKAVIEELKSRKELNLSEKELNEARKALTDKQVQYYLYQLTTERITATANLMQANTRIDELNLQSWNLEWQHNWEKTKYQIEKSKWAVEMKARLTEIQANLDMQWSMHVTSIIADLAKTAIIGGSYMGGKMMESAPQAAGMVWAPTTTSSGGAGYRLQ